MKKLNTMRDSFKSQNVLLTPISDSQAYSQSQYAPLSTIHYSLDTTRRRDSIAVQSARSRSSHPINNSNHALINFHHKLKWLDLGIHQIARLNDPILQSSIIDYSMQQYSDDNEHEVLDYHIPQHSHTSSIARIFKNAVTNLTYNLKHSNFLHTSLLRKKIELGEKSEPVHLLGQTYFYEEEELFLKHFRNTIWLTYRKGIKNIGDDTGWGCMIRSAQMMVAECLKKSMGVGSGEVLKYFNDQQIQKLSLANICKHGKIENRWTSGNEIVSNIKELVAEMEEANLMIHSINEGCIFLADVIEKLHSTKKCHLLVVHNRLGLKNLDPLNFPHLKELMKLRQFVGVLGGETGQAMYVIGYQGEEVLFLDPHYVQQSCSTDIRFFKNTPRGLGMDKLSASISIGFFVKDELDLMDLVSNLYLLEDYYRGQRILNLMLSEETKQELDNMIKRDRKISLDDFQTIQ